MIPALNPHDPISVCLPEWMVLLTLTVIIPNRAVFNVIYTIIQMRNRHLSQKNNWLMYVEGIMCVYVLELHHSVPCIICDHEGFSM